MRYECANSSTVRQELLHVGAVPVLSFPLITQSAPRRDALLVKPVRNAVLAPSLARLFKDAAEHISALWDQFVPMLPLVPPDPRGQHPTKRFLGLPVRRIL